MSSYFSRLGTIAPVAAVYDRRSRASNDYVYDSLNRLQRAYMTNHYSQRYNYGRYGNMACAPGSNYCNTTITFDVGTNQINTTDGSGNRIYLYDAAGNLTQDGTGRGPGSLTHSFQWDAEGRLKSVDSGATASFVYNALGRRVEKQVGSAYTEILYDAFGNVSGYHNRSAWVQDFIPLGSRIFAKYQDGVTYYLHGNPLGSTQVVMRADNSYAQAQNFYSFGGLRWSGGGTVDVRFASMQERDSETTTWQDPLDPTPNRTYTSGLGRWLSPDPVAGDVTNPQSLNRYAYVLNNPTTLTDPTGLQSQQDLYNQCLQLGGTQMNCGMAVYGGGYVYWANMSSSERLSYFFTNTADEFDLMRTPLVSASLTYNPPQPVYTPIDQMTNEYGEAVSVAMYVPGGWVYVTLGAGYVWLAGPLGPYYPPFHPSPSTSTIGPTPPPSSPQPNPAWQGGLEYAGCVTNSEAFLNPSAPSDQTASSNYWAGQALWTTSVPGTSEQPSNRPRSWEVPQALGGGASLLASVPDCTRMAIAGR